MMVEEFGFVEADAARLGVAALPVHRITCDTPGGRVISALSWGVGDPEYVFLHGGGLNAHAWDSTVLALGRPALAVDLPGHGDSEWREDFDYSPETLAASVAPVVASASSSSIVLVGQSLGGLAAIGIAAGLPERVSHLAIVDISPGREPNAGSSRISEFINGPPHYASIEEIVERAVSFGMGRNLDELRRGVLLNTRVRTDGRVIFKHHLANPPMGATIDYEPSRLWPVAEALAIPTLLAFGERGILTMEHVDEFARRVPGSQTAAFDAGHNVHRDQPLALAARIAEFAPFPRGKAMEDVEEGRWSDGADAGL
jgi:pimeloyl-ACP methyl ester carboxylesterase